MRYVTNEQRSRRTLFKPTPWAVAVCLLLMIRCTSRRLPGERLAAGFLGISWEENAKNKTVVKQFPIHENSAHSERGN